MWGCPGGAGTAGWCWQFEVTLENTGRRRVCLAFDLFLGLPTPTWPTRPWLDQELVRPRGRDPELLTLVKAHPAGPALLAEPGVGPVVAAQLLISWSHRGRVRSKAAFASLAGVAPLEASSGQHTRHRLNRRGDRELNRALHTVAITRLRCHPESREYETKRTAQGKTHRDSRRSLKRAIARRLYRCMQAATRPPESRTTAA